MAVVECPTLRAVRCWQMLGPVGSSFTKWSISASDAGSSHLKDSQSSGNGVRRRLTSAVADAMLDTVSFDGDSTMVMDYACGSGMRTF